MEQPILTTARLVLRPFTLDDAPAVERLAGAAEVADTALNIPHPYPPGAAAEWIATHPTNWSSGNGANWAMVERTTNEVCGSISLVIARRHLRAEMGYWLGYPFWNRGYTTEAATAVIACAFNDLGLHRVHAAHFVRNPASGRVMQKAGMLYEGLLRDHMRKGEQYEDIAVYGIVNEA